MSDKKQTPQERYAAKYKKQYSLPCFTSTEQDIIDRLESVPNKAGYIKQLIRDDIARSQKKGGVKSRIKTSERAPGSPKRTARDIFSPKCKMSIRGKTTC